MVGRNTEERKGQAVESERITMNIVNTGKCQSTNFLICEYDEHSSSEEVNLTESYFLYGHFFLILSLHDGGLRSSTHLKIFSLDYLIHTMYSISKLSTIFLNLCLQIFFLNTSDNFLPAY